MEEAFRKRRKNVDQDFIFGGGILTGLGKIKDAIAWASKLGLDFQQAQDLLPALEAFQSAATTDEKLTAFQTLVREFAEVTTKTQLDDQASDLLDQLLVPPLRGFVVAMLDKAMNQTVSEPGLVLSMELPDEPLSQELQLRQIDWAKFIDALTKLIAQFASFK